MPDVEWPPEPFPQSMFAGYREKRMDTRVLSETDMGYIKVRQDVTKPRREFRFSLKFPRDQKSVWDAFLEATNYGTLPFVWRDPDTLPDTPTLKHFWMVDVPEVVDIGVNYQADMNLRELDAPAE